MDLALVGVGGVFGGICRFQLGKVLSQKSNTSFPIGTFLINISGALLLGILTGVDMGNSGYLLFGDGFCGAFTTFSTFMLMKSSVEILIENYRSNLYAAAFNVCKNAQDAEDVVQDTFIQYLSQKKDFESEQHIRAWLIRVAINKAKNKNNTFFRRNSLPLEDYI